MRDLTINLLRILNWNNTVNDTKIQIQFISAHNRGHISHKSVVGNYSENTLILNSAFKISYHQNQNKIICKVSVLKQHRTKEVIGEAEIDLDCFMQRKVYFVTFQDHDKVLQIHKAQQLSEEQLSLQMNQSRNPDKMKISQQQFLQERYNFLDRISKKQSQSKRQFSQRVYNLLKDVKYVRPQANQKKERVQLYNNQNIKGRNNVNNANHYSKNLKQDTLNFVTPQKEQNQEIQQQKNSKMKILDSIKNKNIYINQLDQNQANIANNNRQNQKPKPLNLMINSLQILQNDEKTKREKQIKIEREAILNQIKEDALMEKYYQRERRKK